MTLFNCKTLDEIEAFLSGYDVMDVSISVHTVHEGKGVGKIQYFEEEYKWKYGCYKKIKKTFWVSIDENDRIIRFHSKLKWAKSKIGIEVKKTERILRSPAVMERVRKIESDAKERGDRGYCSVQMFALISGLDYEEADEWCKLHGRNHREGMFTREIRSLLRDAGIEFEDLTHEVREKTKTTLTFERKGWEGEWILFTDDHVLAYVDGTVGDHTANRKFPIQKAWKIKK